MVTKHFLKAVIMFTGIIALGLIGIFLVSYFDQPGKSVEADCKINRLC